MSPLSVTNNFKIHFSVKWKGIADLLHVSVQKCHATVILFCTRFHCRINSKTSVEQNLLACCIKNVLLIVWVAFVSLLVSVRNHIVLFLKSLKAGNNLSVAVK